MDPSDHHPELLARLSSGIAELTNSDQWQRHLGFQSKFRRYSFGNVILIASQCPEATTVAGFRTWAKLGRHVEKGQKAIWILAPMTAPRCSDGPSGDDREICGLKYVPVFDISQTEGEDPPQVCSRLAGDDPGACFSGLVGVARALDYTVGDAELAPGTNGLCSFDLRHIEVEARNSPAQRVKTLAHEIAHAILHEGHRDRSLAELEAESTAYVVCQQFGLDSGAYSFGYVATWAGGGEQAIARIRASCGHIQRAASLMIDLLAASLLDAADPDAGADRQNFADEP
jgi:antirestriction protein ArdC